jgi:hypothetical protein
MLITTLSSNAARVLIDSSMQFYRLLLLTADEPIINQTMKSMLIFCHRLVVHGERRVSIVTDDTRHAIRDACRSSRKTGEHERT